MGGWIRDKVGRAMGALVLAALLWPGSGWAATRVALVVGNGGYNPQNIMKLPIRSMMRN